MKYPTGILRNTVTGRCHPISFRLAPFPGGASPLSDGDRWKSVGHHTEGFATEAEAEAWMASNANIVPVPDRWDWDGKEVPAMVAFFGPEVMQRAIVR